MSERRRAGRLSALWILARIFYRKAELRILGAAANRRLLEVNELAALIGVMCRERTNLVSGVYRMTFKDMGYATNEAGERVNEICWNAPIAITIYVAGRACFGLGVELRGKALCIRQMQGVRGAHVPKNLKDWPELLVKICMIYAEEYGLREVRVYKANQDIGFEFPVLDLADGESREAALKKHHDRLYRRYDRVAHDLKFKKKKRYYVWRVPLKSQPS